MYGCTGIAGRSGPRNHEWPPESPHQSLLSHSGGQNGAADGTGARLGDAKGPPRMGAGLYKLGLRVPRPSWR